MTTSVRAEFTDELEFDWGGVEPERYLAALEYARARMDRAIFVWCPFGRCEIAIDPVDNAIISAVGIVGCGCDNLPGWRSKYYDGLPKPGWAGKARGRHGGRVQASRRKHEEHARWARSWG